jgi:hypothetical protein
MGSCLQHFFNELEASGHCQYRQCVGCYFFDFFSLLSSQRVRPRSFLMDLCLQVFVNAFEAPGHCRYRQCLG